MAVTGREPREREVLDLDDPEQLAQALMLGAVQSLEVSAARLAELGRAHAELLIEHRTAAGRAEATVNELAAARDEIFTLRAVNLRLVEQLYGPKPAEQDASDRLLAIAIAIATDPHSVIGLLLSSSVTACLVAAAPRGALQAGVQVFEAALADIARIDAAAAIATSEVKPS